MIYRNGFLLKIYTSSYDLIRLLPVLVYPFLLSAIGNTSNLPWFQSGAGYSASYSLAKSMNSVGETLTFMALTNYMYMCR